MDFMSNNNAQYYRLNYKQNIGAMTYSNFNYRAANESALDNNLSCLNCNYTIRPAININYAQPYNTGKCVAKKEQTQVPFTLQNQVILFSDLVN